MIIGTGAHAKVRAKPPTLVELWAHLFWHIVVAALAKLDDFCIAFPAMHVLLRRLAFSIGLVFVHQHPHVLNQPWYDWIF